jgi:hypothetical protein
MENRIPNPDPDPYPLTQLILDPIRIWIQNTDVLFGRRPLNFNHLGALSI